MNSGKAVGDLPLGTKTAKFQTLIQLLQAAGPGLSIARMAAELRVNERTVKRYLADLRRLDFDLIQDADSRGRKTLYRIQGSDGPPTHLLTALRKIRSELISGGNPKHSSPISQVIQYLEKGDNKDAPKGRRASQPPAPASGPVASEPLGDRSSDVYYIDHGPFAESDPSSNILKILEGAVAANNSLRITYGSPTKETEEFLFFPYILCLRVGTLYLIGRQGENRGAFKSLSVKRIKRGIVRDAFKPDPFNPADYYKFTFGQWHRQLNEDPETVLLSLRAKWLEKFLSESHFNPPGRIIRKGKDTLFEVKVVIKPDFVNWVISLVPDLVPAKPDSLREEVTRRLRQGVEAMAE